jgi:ArsR family transcriptional regulator
MRQQLSEFKADFFKALAHPLRISILDALRDGELTVNEISQRFDVEQANASQQLAVLRNRNIVVTRKEGANVYYSVSDKSIFKLLDAAKEIFNHHLVGVRIMLEEIHEVAPIKAAGRSSSQRAR